MAKKDDFYKEIDERRHKISCGCVPLLLFLIFLLITGSYLTWWSVKQIKSRLSLPKAEISQFSLENAEKKLQDFLQNIKETNQEVKVTVTDSELSSLLVKNEKLAKGGRFEIENPNAVIDKDGINLTGDLVKPLRGKIAVSGKMVVEKGKLSYKIDSARVGKLKVPNILKKSIGAAVNRLITGRLNSDKVVYESVSYSEHKLTILGKRANF